LNGISIDLSFTKFVGNVFEMLPKRLYNLLVGLFPLVYLIHNLEEKVLLDFRIYSILRVVPVGFKHITTDDPQMISSVFGIALIVATIIPLIVSIVIWNKVTIINIKILLVIAFVTLINAFSHISSSFAFGFLSPGFFTGILLCIPFSVATIFSIRKHYKFTLKRYLLFGVGSLIVYALGIVFSWFIGFLLVTY